MTLFETLLLGISVLAYSQGIPDPAPAPWAAHPCPEPNDILPCECKLNDAEEYIDLNCSQVSGDAELAGVFQAHFPFPAMRRLIIITKTSDERVPITSLTSETFNGTSFSEIHISHTTLRNITSDAFKESYERLETVIVTDSYLESFPFDMLAECPSLADVRVFRNKLTFMPNIVSSSLKYLQISYNPGLTMLSEAFKNAPNLEYVIMNDINFINVAPHMFETLSQLKYLDLSYNDLETLYPTSLRFVSSQLEQVKLDGNSISSVYVDAISGLTPPMYLWMQHNNLKELLEGVWKTAFQEVAADPNNNLFVFDDNPMLVCECDTLWLLQNDTFMDTVAIGTYCDNGSIEIHDIDPEFVEANC